MEIIYKNNTQPYLSNRGWYCLFFNKEVFWTAMENYIYNMFELAIGKNRLSEIGLNDYWVFRPITV